MIKTGRYGVQAPPPKKKCQSPPNKISADAPDFKLPYLHLKVARSNSLSRSFPGLRPDDNFKVQIGHPGFRSFLWHAPQTTCSKAHQWGTPTSAVSQQIMQSSFSWTFSLLPVDALLPEDPASNPALSSPELLSFLACLLLLMSHQVLAH